jgi:hypothetical protein
MRKAGVEQNALGGRRLARIDMGHNANIPISIYWRAAGHADQPRVTGLSV